jgi:hypothetical protein
MTSAWINVKIVWLNYRRTCRKKLTSKSRNSRRSRRSAMMLRKRPTSPSVTSPSSQRGAISMFNESKRYESDIQRFQSEVHRANNTESQTALAERDSTVENLRSLLERHNHELDCLEQSVTITQEERARLQLHSNNDTTVHTVHLYAL